MFGLGTWELVLILLVALIFLGPQKLPEIAKSLGKGVRQMRNAMDGLDREVRDSARYEPPRSDGRPAPPRPTDTDPAAEDAAMHAAAADVMRDAHRPPEGVPDDAPEPAGARAARPDEGGPA